MDFQRPDERPTQQQHQQLDDNSAMPPVVQQEPAQQFPQPKKRSKGHILTTTIMSILVLGLAAYGAYAYLAQQQLQQRESDLTSRVNSLENQLQTATKKQQTTDTQKTDVTAGDKKAIIAVVTANETAAVATKDAKVVVTVVKQNAEFAYVTVGYPEGGGVANILKKVDDTWVIVYRGNDAVPTATVTKYGIPTEYQSAR